MTFEYTCLVWFQTIGLKETAVSDQSRFQANGGAVYNTPEWEPETIKKFAAKEQ